MASEFTGPAPVATTDDLIARCLAGDQGAWEDIVRLHWRKVFNVAYKFVGKHDEAEDLTQDIFLKIFRSLHTFDRRANFVTWLISVSRNLCIDHYRSVRKERETINRDVDAGTLFPVSREVTPYKALEFADQREMLRRALEWLAPTPPAPARSCAAGACHCASPSPTASAPCSTSAPRISRRAVDSPQIRVMRCVPPAAGSRPSRASGKPSRALSATTRRSQASANSKPPPSAGPPISATDTRGLRSMRA